MGGEPKALSAPPDVRVPPDGNTPVFYRQMIEMCADFNLRPNGQLTYFNILGEQSYALDKNEHELRILPGGHDLLLGDDPETVDMSQVVPGGYPTATVIGNVIRELDEDKYVAFEWRRWDPFLITDAMHENMTASVIDYAHANGGAISHRIVHLD